MTRITDNKRDAPASNSSSIGYRFTAWLCAAVAVGSGCTNSNVHVPVELRREALAANPLAKSVLDTPNRLPDRVVLRSGSRPVEWQLVFFLDSEGNQCLSLISATVATPSVAKSMCDSASPFDLGLLRASVLQIDSAGKTHFLVFGAASPLLDKYEIISERKKVLRTGTFPGSDKRLPFGAKHFVIDLEARPDIVYGLRGDNIIAGVLAQR